MANSHCDQKLRAIPGELKQSNGCSWNDFINWESIPRNLPRQFELFHKVIEPNSLIQQNSKQVNQTFLSIIRFDFTVVFLARAISWF